MSTPAIVWLSIGLVALTAVVAMAVGLVRHGLVLGRAVARFGREAGPIVRGISEASGARSGRR